MDRLKYLKILSDATRLRIIEFLMDGEKCACKIVPHTGKSQPNVSLHLRRMEEAGILGSRRVGTNIFYSIKDHKVAKILKLLEEQ